MFLNFLFQIIMNIEENSAKDNSFHNSQNLLTTQDKNLTDEELRFKEAKNERLKMEQAALTLENRVLYLEKINNKMNKKIEGAKTKAVEIMKIKKETSEELDFKKLNNEKKEAELKDQKQKIQDFKAFQEERLNKSKVEVMAHSVTIAKNTKESLQVC